MDEQTRAYYASHASDVARRYATAHSGHVRRLSLAFSPGQRVLDIGAGSGRDVSQLLAMGIDAFGVEPCDELRAQAAARYPELAGRLQPGELPGLGRPFGGSFDGVLCSAVLMHLPREELFDAAFAIRSVLRDAGHLLLSIPVDRPGLDAANRDEHGRLFTRLGQDYLQLLFERLGFQLVDNWHGDDAAGRPGYTWCTLLLQLRHGEGVRPA